MFSLAIASMIMVKIQNSIQLQSRKIITQEAKKIIKNKKKNEINRPTLQSECKQNFIFIREIIFLSIFIFLCFKTLKQNYIFFIQCAISPLQHLYYVHTHE